MDEGESEESHVDLYVVESCGYLGYYRWEACHDCIERKAWAREAVCVRAADAVGDVFLSRERLLCRTLLWVSSRNCRFEEVGILNNRSRMFQVQVKEYILPAVSA